MTESPAGKAGLVVFVVAAVGLAVFAGVRANTGTDSKPADDKDVKLAAQKQIDIIRNNPNIDPKTKAEIIAHEEGLLQGGSKGAGTSSPHTSSPGG